MMAGALALAVGVFGVWLKSAKGVVTWPGMSDCTGAASELQAAKLVTSKSKIVMDKICFFIRILQ